jgi:hypothetical protein
MNLLIRLALEMNAYFSCLHFWDSQFDKVFIFISYDMFEYN